MSSLNQKMLKDIGDLPIEKFYGIGRSQLLRCITWEFIMDLILKGICLSCRNFGKAVLFYDIARGIDVL
jgi:hypothetical protein